MPNTPIAKRNLIRSFAWILAALVVAAAVLSFIGQSNSIFKTLMADIAATLVIFVFGHVFRNASFYDPYWSLAPIIIALYWLLFINKYEAISWNQLLVLGLVIIWGLRLTFNWASQWQGQKHEDWRYVEYRRTSGELFWAVELVGIELVPTTVVFLGCLSLYPVLTEVSPSFGFMQMAATALTLTAILLETTADFQLKRFLDQKLPPGSIMNKGLWKYSRHPNYLGEILFWWGLWLFIPGYGIIRWLALSGPLAVTALFVFVSIPLMEKHNLSRRSCYSQHAKKISVLIPWFPKND
jgi:steroid 5-alpha reductase family enzyme